MDTSGTFFVELRKKLKIKTQKKRLYKEAFTHSSVNKKTYGGEPLNFERLEFLGDAVLNSIIADFLYRYYPNAKEGALTKLRAKIVSRSKLNQIGKKMDLHAIAEIANQLAISSDNHTKIIETCKKLRIDLVVIGPEGPLVAGLADQLQHNGIKTFGPKAAAAAIEGSKIFMKELLQEYKIPTAAFRRFHNPDAAKK